MFSRVKALLCIWCFFMSPLFRKMYTWSVLNILANQIDSLKKIWRCLRDHIFQVENPCLACSQAIYLILCIYQLYYIYKWWSYLSWNTCRVSKVTTVQHIDFLDICNCFLKKVFFLFNWSLLLLQVYSLLLIPPFHLIALKHNISAFLGFLLFMPNISQTFSHSS